MVKVLHLSEVDSAVLFNSRAFMLGGDKGNWIVVDELYALARYENKEDAQEHADMLNSPTDPDSPFAKMKSPDEILEYLKSTEIDFKDWKD